MAELKDSGSRRDFGTGAVRDIAEGKGRCDLLPLEEVSDFFGDDCVLRELAAYQGDRCMAHLFYALRLFSSKCFADDCTMILEVAIHFEDGARKYGDNNWRKGIPARCYLDSAIRHYLKHRRGDTDEPHHRAFAWNILCMIWELKHHDQSRYEEDA